MTLAHRPRKKGSARQETFITYGPLWCSDWRERLRALLPELAVSTVGAACLTAVFVIKPETDVAALFAVSLVVQLLVQLGMYVSTYVMDLKSNTWIPYVILLLVSSGPVFWGVFITGLPMATATSSVDVTSLSLFAMPAGVGFFWSTRRQPFLALFVVEMLSLASAVDDLKIALPLHVTFWASFAVLYAMRNSATRITVNFEAGGRLQATRLEEGDKGFPLGMFGQVVGFAAAAVALCLVASLAALSLMPQRPEQQFILNDPTAQTQQGTTAEDEPAATGGVAAGGAEASAGADTGGQTGGARHSGMPAWLLVLLLLALPFMPFVACLLRRRWRRQAIEREPQAADRAARLYLGIIERLKAADIVRDEWDTPSEFLAHHGMELEELVAPAGIDLVDWIALTDTYEKVRYAGEDPTETELATCWRLYDVLPACVREQEGWRSFLLDGFWRL